MNPALLVASHQTMEDPLSSAAFHLGCPFIIRTLIALPPNISSRSFHCDKGCIPGVGELQFRLEKDSKAEISDTRFTTDKTP